MNSVVLALSLSRFQSASIVECIINSGTQLYYFGENASLSRRQKIGTGDHAQSNLMVKFTTWCRAGWSRKMFGPAGQLFESSNSSGPVGCQISHQSIWCAFKWTPCKGKREEGHANQTSRNYKPTSKDNLEVARRKSSGRFVLSSLR